MIVDSHNLNLLWRIFKLPMDQNHSIGNIGSLRVCFTVGSCTEDSPFDVASEHTPQYFSFFIYLDRGTLVNVFQIPEKAVKPEIAWDVARPFTVATHRPAIEFLFPQNKDNKFEDYVTLRVDDHWIGTFTFEEFTEYGEEVRKRILKDGKYLPKKDQLVYTEQGLKDEISNIVDPWINQLITSESTLVDPAQIPIHRLYRQISQHFQCDERECLRIEYSDGEVDDHGIAQDTKSIEMDCRYKRRGSWAHTYVYIRKDGKETVASVSIDVLLGQLAALNLINQQAEIIGV